MATSKRTDQPSKSEEVLKINGTFEQTIKAMFKNSDATKTKEKKKATN